MKKWWNRSKKTKVKVKNKHFLLHQSTQPINPIRHHQTINQSIKCHKWLSQIFQKKTKSKIYFIFSSFFLFIDLRGFFLFSIASFSSDIGVFILAVVNLNSNLIFYFPSSFIHSLSPINLFHHHHHRHHLSFFLSLPLSLPLPFQFFFRNIEWKKRTRNCIKIINLFFIFCVFCTCKIKN